MPRFIQWSIGIWAVLFLVGSAIADPEVPGPRGSSAVAGATVSGFEVGDAWSGETMLVVAYAALWVILMGYVLRLALAQARLHREIEALQARMDQNLKESP